MNRLPRIVLMPGNNALIDARVMKNLRSAAELGYDAIALGISRGETIHQETLPHGGRVIIQPVNQRYELWRRYRRGRVWFDRTDRSIGRAYARYLYQNKLDDPARAARDLNRVTSVKRPHQTGRVVRLARRVYALAIRVLVKTRSLRADREIKRDTWYAVRLEAWRRGRYAWLRLTPWRARWRRALPYAVDQAIDLGPRLDELAPDIVHVHDVYMMHVAVQYAGRAALAGRAVRLIYDAREFVPGLAHVDPVRVEAYSRLEAEYIQDFDRVITVSESLADLLVKRHGLVRRPDLVLNAPITEPLSPGTPDVRQAAGLGPEVFLLVYSGVVNPARGVGVVLYAMLRHELDDVHLAVVANNRGTAVRQLIGEADYLGLADRLHVLPFVPYDQVTAYISTADVGLSPLSRAVNHDVALTNKFCEYIAAGLPIVTSDTPEQAGLVEDLDLGAVFEAENPEACAVAIKRVIDRLAELNRRLKDDAALRHRFSWEAQVPVLARIYADQCAALGLTPPQPRPTRPPQSAASASQTES
ncbi:MAG: glycosyltransferase [Bifidobacteriaceae bacterium]|jgi:glycosyltransferase involved in cell wall biosynthesis|nr:glycosyltransferase [Bifidobacteriaceae bacterium]